MGDPGRQRPDRFQFRGLDQLQLGRLQFLVSGFEFLVHRREMHHRLFQLFRCLLALNYPTQHIGHGVEKFVLLRFLSVILFDIQVHDAQHLVGRNDGHAVMAMRGHAFVADLVMVVKVRGKLDFTRRCRSAAVAAAKWHKTAGGL